MYTVLLIPPHYPTDCFFRFRVKFDSESFEFKRKIYRVVDVSYSSN